MKTIYVVKSSGTVLGIFTSVEKSYEAVKQVLKERGHSEKDYKYFVGLNQPQPYGEIGLDKVKTEFSNRDYAIHQILNKNVGHLELGIDILKRQLNECYY